MTSAPELVDRVPRMLLLLIDHIVILDICLHNCQVWFAVVAQNRSYCLTPRSSEVEEHVDHEFWAHF